MNTFDTTPFDANVDSALNAIKAHDGPLLVDLDETLYLSNSTEDFLDQAAPGLLALIVLKALETVKPWHWSGGNSTRDIWRVRCIEALFPWTAKIWRARVNELAHRFANRALITALSRKEFPVTIVTVGFESIVRPLIVALGFTNAKLVAARVSTLSDRRAGKLKLTMDALGSETIRKSLFITDSTLDAPLLRECARPLRVVWPDSICHVALSRIYMPGQYLSLVKRPGQRYIYRAILQEDFAFWVLSSIFFAASPVTHVIGLLFLLFSFWIIYELGYVDNDLIGARFETHPKLSSTFYSNPVATPTIQPWVWAICAGVAALFVLRWPHSPAPVDFAKWAGLLAGVHLIFLIYNRMDKTTRIWLFASLQFARVGSFALLVPISPIGASVLGSHILTRWVPYFGYRTGASKWSDENSQLIRLAFFLVLGLLLVISEGLSSVVNWSGGAILAWCLFRARYDLRALFQKAHRIDQVRAPESNAR